MTRLLVLAAILCALSGPSAALARPIAPDGGAPLPATPVDTNPWYVNAILTVTVNADGGVSLTDQSGTPVHQLAPGAYSFWIRDWSAAANFHVVGPHVDVASSVAGTGYDAWRVVIDPGTYSFFSDTDPSAGGTFTVPALYRW